MRQLLIEVSIEKWSTEALPYPQIVERGVGGFLTRYYLHMNPISRKARGFTLIELVIVLILLTIVAVFIAPRLFTNEFEELGFAEESLAIVRYAHKLAVASGCAVQVAVTPGAGGSIALSYSGADGCAPGSVQNPAGGVFAVTAPTSVTVAGATFIFNLIGNPSADITITISGTTTRTITVTNETGFVVSS